MKSKNELNVKDLKMTCNPNIFKFDTTAELDPIQTGIGQDRGIKALEFGIQVDVKGYNIYIEGPSGVGKTMYTKNYLNKVAAKKNAAITTAKATRTHIGLLSRQDLLQKSVNEFL